MSKKKKQNIFFILLFLSTFFYGQECIGEISSFPYNESFENTIEEWTQSSADDLDWTIKSGGTSSNSTGPNSANEGSYYIYVEASIRRTGYPTKQAIIISPCYDLSELSAASFNFDYHMYGATDMGTIALEASTDNGAIWTSIWSESGNKGNQWNSASVNLSSYLGSTLKLRFNRITGSTWQADIAIDNISLTGTKIPTTPPTSNGYLGPGGVGNTDGTTNLVLWLNANDIDADGDKTNNPANLSSLASWNDLSGHDYNYSQENTTNQPTYNTSSINSYPASNFDGDDFINGTDIGYNEGTALFVLNATDYTNRSRLLNKAGNTSLRFEQWNNSGNIGFTRYGIADYNSGINSPFGVDAILSFSKQDASNNYEIRKLTNSQEASATLNVGSTDASIYTNEFGNFTNGNVSEIIVYSTVLSTAEKIITDNYLSAKYGLILQNNDYYTQDNSGLNFDHNVAGIGQASDGSNHTDSQGTGIVRINTPDNLSNGDFLFWGENVKNANYNFSSNINYKEVLDTKWRVSKVGDLGTVSFSIKASDIDLSNFNCGNLNLIVSNSSSFAIKTSYALTLTDGIYSKLNLTLNNGDYFTLEYSDLIVVDDTQFHNGSGTSNAPNITDDCYKLLVKSAANGTLALTEDADVREIEVETGGILTVETGHRLKVTNGINNNGDIRLVGTSQLVQTHTTGTNLNTGSGNLYIDQNSELTSVYRYNYWSSPVKEMGSSQYTVKGVMKNGTTATSATSTPTDLTFTTDYDGLASPLTLSSYWIYGYLNGTDRSTWSQKGELGTFNPGEGYLLKSPGIAQNYTFKGIPNDGNISFSVDADKTSLLGNPYPSAIDANQLFTDSSNLATIYFWEHKNEVSTSGNEGHYLAGYIGGYSYRNATMGTAADSKVCGTAGIGGETYTSPGRYIPVGQGFFVETASGAAATINFKNEQRNFETETGDSHFFKTNSKQNSTEGYPILKFGFEAKTSEGIYIHSQVGISFSEENTFKNEIGFDSKKAEIKDSDIYFQFEEEGDKLVIAGVNEITDDLLVPLTLKIDNEEDIFLMLDEKKNIEREVYIFDAIENIYYDLSAPIHLNLPKREYSNRFYITFKNETLSTVDQALNASFNIYQNNKTQELVIKNVNNLNLQKITLYNFTGKKIIQLTDKETLKDTEITFKTNKISTSVYIVNITTSQGVISKKVFIQ